VITEETKIEPSHLVVFDDDGDDVVVVAAAATVATGDEDADDVFQNELEYDRRIALTYIESGYSLSIGEAIQKQIYLDKVISEFSTEFDLVSEPGNKTKLHFSNKLILDGARKPWMLLIFLDGLFQAFAKPFSTSTTRRIFDQKETVKSCFKRNLNHILYENSYEQFSTVSPPTIGLFASECWCSMEGTLI